MTSGPLAGMRILDLTNYLAGPFCTMLLGDLGAEVVKVEGIEGDPSRGAGPPFINGVSAYFLLINRNKKSIRLDLKSSEGRELFLRLVSTADAVIENFRPGVMDRLGIGYDRLKREKSDVIYAGIHGFGEQGPRADLPAFDHIMQGFSGWMSITGTTESGPLRAGPSVGDLMSGLFATIGVIGALLHKVRTGEGQKVVTSLLEALIATAIPHVNEYFATGGIPKGEGNGHPILVPFGTFQAADGYLNIAASGAQWKRLCQVLELEQFLADPSLEDNAGRAARRDEIHSAIARATRGRRREEWIPLFKANGIPCAPINNVAEALSDPQSVVNGTMVELVHSTAGRYKTLNNPIKMKRAETSKWLVPPLLGQHTAEILADLGVGAADFQKLQRDGVV